MPDEKLDSFDQFLYVADDVQRGINSYFNYDIAQQQIAHGMSPSVAAPGATVLTASAGLANLLPLLFVVGLIVLMFRLFVGHK